MIIKITSKRQVTFPARLLLAGVTRRCGQRHQRLQVPPHTLPFSLRGRGALQDHGNIRAGWPCDAKAGLYSSPAGKGAFLVSRTFSARRGPLTGSGT